MCKDLETGEVVEIDLTSYFGNNAGVMAIDGCMQRSLIEAGYLTAVNQHNFTKLENYLQVTIDNRMLLFNLNTKKPALVNQIDGSDMIMDPDKFVQLGFIPSYTYSYKENDEMRDYQSQLLNPIENIIIKVTKNDNREQKIEGIYKRYTNQDLHIALKLQKDAECSGNDRKLTDTVLFASFDGFNILELMKEDLATFTAVLQDIESKIESEADEVDSDLVRVAGVLHKRKITEKEDHALQVSSLVTQLLMRSPPHAEVLLKMGNFSD